MAQLTRLPKYIYLSLDDLTYGDTIPDTFDPTACLQTSDTNARAPCVVLEKCYAPFGVEDVAETQCRFLKLRLQNDSLIEWLRALDETNKSLLVQNSVTFFPSRAMSTEWMNYHYRPMVKHGRDGTLYLRIRIGDNHDRPTNVFVRQGYRWVRGTVADLRAGCTVLPHVEFSRAGKFGMCAPLAVDVFVCRGGYASRDDEPVAEVALPAPESACVHEHGGGAGAVVSGETAASHTTGTAHKIDSSSEDDS